jgi:hypothetical protein
VRFYRDLESFLLAKIHICSKVRPIRAIEVEVIAASPVRKQSLISHRAMAFIGRSLALVNTLYACKFADRVVPPSKIRLQPVM